MVLGYGLGIRVVRDTKASANQELKSAALLGLLLNAQRGLASHASLALGSRNQGSCMPSSSFDILEEGYADTEVVLSVIIWASGLGVISCAAMCCFEARGRPTPLRGRLHAKLGPGHLHCTQGARLAVFNSSAPRIHRGVAGLRRMSGVEDPLLNG